MNELNPDKSTEHDQSEIVMPVDVHNHLCRPGQLSDFLYTPFRRLDTFILQANRKVTAIHQEGAFITMQEFQAEWQKAMTSWKRGEMLCESAQASAESD